MGARGANMQSSTGTMMERVSSGENLIGYNILGSYALTRAKKDPSIGIAFTTDYNLVLSRLVFVAKNAKNPNAGRLWLDYLLSKRGQTITSEQAELFSVRTDMTGKDSGTAFAKELGSAVKPIAVNNDLLHRARPDQATRIPQAVADGARKEMTRMSESETRERRGDRKHSCHPERAQRVEGSAVRCMPGDASLRSE